MAWGTKSGDNWPSPSSKEPGEATPKRRLLWQPCRSRQERQDFQQAPCTAEDLLCAWRYATCSPFPAINQGFAATKIAPIFQMEKLRLREVG